MHLLEIIPVEELGSQATLQVSRPLIESQVVCESGQVVNLVSVSASR